MNREKKDEYKTRILAANRSSLIVIMYEIMFDYLDEANSYFESDNVIEALKSLSYADDVLKRLEDDLDMKYDISRELYSLYRFCREGIASVRVTHNQEYLTKINAILKNLYEGMKGMEKEDHSKPLFKARQTMVAGLTYGRSDITEIYSDNKKRGFYA